MKISLKWLEDYLNSGSMIERADEIAKKLTMAGLEVEGVHRQDEGFEKVITAKILKKEKHPDADKLSVCELDNGKEVKQVVCGASNHKAGDIVALAEVGAKLPCNLEIKASKIRGAESHGMLCSEEELKLSEKSEGIIIFPPETPIGEPVAKILKRDDIILEINVTANRGDCLSHIGIAREVAVLLKTTLTYPEIKSKRSDLKSEVAGFTVESQETRACPIYTGRVIKGIKIGESPAWLKTKLKSMGLNPINNIVDITNFVLFEYGQPLHAFDLDKIQGKKIVARFANEGEKIKLLDGTEVNLTSHDCVIADTRPIALAGIMGGEETKVDENTKNIFLEGAVFHAGMIRKSSKRLGKASDSSFRFEREVSPFHAERASARAAELIVEIAGGVKEKGFVFSGDERKFDEQREELNVSKEYIRNLLGVEIPNDEAIRILESLEFKVKDKGQNFLVVPPSHRRDISQQADIVEELIRIFGYNNIDSSMPHARTEPSNIYVRRFMDSLKEFMKSEGLHEAVHFAFDHDKNIVKLSEKLKENLLTIANPITEDLNVLKTSLLPNLCKTAALNLNRQVKNVRLFELRNIFRKDETTETKTSEQLSLAGIILSDKLTSDWSGKNYVFDFFDMKGLFERMALELNLKGFNFSDQNIPEYFHPYKTAAVTKGKAVIGYFGVISPMKANAFDIPDTSIIFEFNYNELKAAASENRKFKEIPKFPSVTRDFSVLIKEDFNASAIEGAINKVGKPLVKKVEFFDKFKGAKIPEGFVSISFSTTMWTEDKTLTDAEVQGVVSKIEKELSERFGIERRKE